MGRRLRLDDELVRRNLVASREEAYQMVHAGRVLVAGCPSLNPARSVATHEPVRVLSSTTRFVTRGGEKLAAALDQFEIAPRGLRCLDVGASGGGFTDCLLQYGAKAVVALDVGYGLLHERLRSDDRVILRERTNVRHVNLQDLGGKPFDLITVDVSFISLTAVVPKLVRDLASSEADLIILIKPQFEATHAEASKGKGVIRDHEVWRRVLLSVLTRCEEEGAFVQDLTPSPILGGKGNIEFLAYLRRGGALMSDLHESVDAALGSIRATC